MSASSNPPARGVVETLLFLSGATGLIYEVGWSQKLAQVIGHSGEASAVVLATFMGGLALGAYLFGKRADRSVLPLRLYGLLEIGVAVWALLLSACLHRVAELYYALPPALPGEVRALTRVLLSISVLLPPTVLMGGTLPALVRHFTAELPALEKTLSRLYGVNSLGAGLGALLAGLFLIPALGLQLSLTLTAVLSAVLGSIAIALGTPRRSSAAVSPPMDPGPRASITVPRPPSGSRAVAPLLPPRLRFAYAGLALTGFGALLGEVGFIRLLAVVLGSSTYAFTLIVAAYVLGMGLGSFCLSRRASDGSTALSRFGRFQVLLVVAVVLDAALFSRLPYEFWKWSAALQRTPFTWPLYEWLTFGTCFAVVGAPAFLLGAAFPIGARAAAREGAGLGRGLGLAYLVNTLGTVAGAGVGGLVLLPALGLEGVFGLVIAAHALAAVLALAPGTADAAERWARRIGIGVAAAGLLFYVRTERGWATFVASTGVFRLRETPPPSYAEMRASWDRALRVLFHRDDAVDSVVVLEEAGTRHRTLRINGKPDAGNGIDTETQVLLGQLGILLHPRDVQKVLVVGLGSGSTLGAVLTHPVAQVDAVELSPAVVEAAGFFDTENRHALADPRARIYLDDAKTFLATHGEDYDLVISEPSNPWTVGSSALFTRDFFRDVAAHMRPDGILVQWCHTYESSSAILQLIVRTLRDTFPHSVTWRSATDVIFIASRAPLKLSLPTLNQRLTRPAARASLASAGVVSPLTLLALQMQTDSGQAGFAGEGIINTDDHNWLEFAAPIAFFLDAPFNVPDERRRPGAERLWVTELLPSLTAEDARDVYQLLTKNPDAPEALTFSVAERWARLAPESTAAACALSEAAGLRGDWGLALSALAPRIREGERQSRPLALYLWAAAREAERRLSIFQPDWGAEYGDLARWTLDHTSDAAAQAAAKDYLRAAARTSMLVQP